MSRLDDLNNWLSTAAANGTAYDFDGAYSVQCFDLANKYVNDYYGFTVAKSGMAVYFIDDALSLGHMKGWKIGTTGTPPAGAIVSFGEPYGWYQGAYYGHVGVMGKGNISYHQNWTGNNDGVRAVAWNGSLQNAMYKWALPPDMAGGSNNGGKQSAIDQFKAGGDVFNFVKDIRVDAINQVNGIWQFVNYDLAGGRNIDWTNNGIPLDIVDNVTRGNEAATQVGDMVRMQADYNHGTIDQYDVPTNGVGISMGDYGMIWFNADALLYRF